MFDDTSRRTMPLHSNVNELLKSEMISSSNDIEGRSTMKPGKEKKSKADGFKNMFRKSVLGDNQTPTNNMRNSVMNKKEVDKQMREASGSVSW